MLTRGGPPPNDAEKREFQHETTTYRHSGGGLVPLACWAAAPPGKDAVSHPPTAGQTGSVSALPTDAAGETPSQPSDAPELSETPEISKVPEPTPVPDTPPYEFGQPVAESGPVDEDYFDDAVFLGDSRTEGLQLYSGLKSGDFFWHKGMTVFRGGMTRSAGSSRWTAGK